MTGCRHGAKNTLLTNYLHLAERAGAVVVPAHDGSLAGAQAGRRVARAGPRGRPRSVPVTSHTGAGGHLTAGQVVLAAGAFGTQKLLQTMALEGKLPELSLRLGELTRTNSESLARGDGPQWPCPPRFQPRRGNNLLVFTLSPVPMPNPSATGMVPT